MVETPPVLSPVLGRAEASTHRTDKSSTDRLSTDELSTVDNVFAIVICCAGTAYIVRIPKRHACLRELCHADLNGHT